MLQTGAFLLGSTCSVINVPKVWSRLWSLQAEWLCEDARARREVNLFLPVVLGLESLDQLTLVTYEELVG